MPRVHFIKSSLLSWSWLTGSQVLERKSLGHQKESTTLAQQEDRNYLAQKVDNFDYTNMEED